MALPGEHLAESVGHVDDADRGAVQPGALECAVDDLGGQRGEVEAFAGEIAREVALVATEDPDARHASTVLQLTE